MVSSHDDGRLLSTQLPSGARLVEKHPFAPVTDTQLVARSSLTQPLRVIYIDYVHSPRSRVEHWKGIQSQPTEINILHAGWVNQAELSADRTGTAAGIPTEVQYIDEPGNLTRIGTELVKLLQETKNDSTQLIAFVDSLSLLLQYSSLGTVVRFIGECLDQFETHDAISRFYIDPTVHDPTALSKLRTIIEASDD